MSCDARRVLELVALDQRDGNGRHAEQRALHRRRHGAGVRHVVAEIGAVVNARYDEHRALGQEAEHAEVHAIRRRAVHGVPALTPAMHAERPVQRERVAAGALLALRRQHVHLAEVVEGGGEGREPGRVDTVVIGDEQDGHRCLDATAPCHQSAEKPDGGKMSDLFTVPHRSVRGLAKQRRRRYSSRRRPHNVSRASVQPQGHRYATRRPSILLKSSCRFWRSAASSVR